MHAYTFAAFFLNLTATNRYSRTIIVEQLDIEQTHAILWRMKSSGKFIFVSVKEMCMTPEIFRIGVLHDS